VPRFVAILCTTLVLAIRAAPCSAITVTPEQQAALGIEVAEVSAVSEAPLAELPARVTLPADRSSAVVVPLSGTVVRMLVRDGQTVRKGQPLAQFHSAEYLEVEAGLKASAARLKVLEAQVSRDRQLVAEGIAPARRLQEGEAELGAARADNSAHAARLATVQGIPGVPGEYRLLAPTAGRVAEAGLSTGQRVEAGTVAFNVLEGDEVWVEAQLPERLVDAVAPGFRVEAGEPTRNGEVLSVGMTLDPSTRSALLRAKLPAGPGLRPGQSTELLVFAPVAAGTVVVPAAALTRIGGQESVFRASDGGFVAVPVTTGLRTARGVAVHGDGLAGGRVVVSGVSALKALAQED
jgi:cobalt-zinc-cadmium efflux system membrane fusion protein